ncbi:MAG: amino acid ABC transporter permease [Oscillospiraceae bacterium]|nr:amino acid ABC transporter permease [Oscillospiraceae bacterium]
MNWLTTWLLQLHDTFIVGERYMMLIDGLKNTLIISLGALLIGVVLGSLIAIVKYFSEDNPKLTLVRWICDIYITVLRGVPVTVQLLIFFFIIMKAADGITVAVVAFGINSSAYVAEVVRSGILSVDPGQMEAGRSLGMSSSQTMWKIIMPQAMKNILPAIGNEMIALLKETSVAGYVAVVDLTRAGNLIRNNTYDAVNPLLFVAVTYLVLVVGLTAILGRFERRLRKSDKR